MDCALILAHELRKDKTLSDESKQRIDLGIKLLKERKVDYLILSGGCEHIYGVTLAEVMKDYAIQKGIDDKNILEENLSRDTVGQLIFSKQIIKIKKFKEIAIITHDYHLDRVEKEAEFIFGRQYNLRYYGIASRKINEKKKEEEENYGQFKKTFKKVKAGDNERILHALFAKHPFYNKDPEFFKEGLKKLKENL